MKTSSLLVFFSVIVVLAGCAPHTKINPNDYEAPQPIEGTHGTYMCPYTSDGTVAKWVEKGMNVKIGKAAGTAIGSELLKNIPFGDQLGRAAGRAIAIKMMGGMEYIKENSDLSFNDIKKMRLYLWVVYSNNEHYHKVIDLMSEIYPEVLAPEPWQYAWNNKKLKQ